MAGRMGFVTGRWRGMWREGGCGGLKLRAKFSGQIRGEGKSGVGRVVSSRQGKDWASGSGKGKVNSSREGGQGDGERLIKVTRGELGVERGETGDGEREGAGTGAGGENRGGAQGKIGDTEGAGTKAGGVVGDTEGDGEETTKVVTGRFTRRGV